MNLLRVCFEGVKPYKNGKLEVDFFAKDRVTSDEEVHEIVQPVYSQSVVVFSGINASGKTTTLKLLYLALNILSGKPNILEGLENFNIFDEEVKITLYFQIDNMFYRLESLLLVGARIADKRGYVRSNVLYQFKQETLLGKKRKPSTKEEIFDFSAPDVVTNRESLDLESIKYLSPSSSILQPIIQEKPVVVEQLIESIYSPKSDIGLGSTYPEILQMFDSSIESLERDSMADNSFYQLKFKKSPEAFPVHRDLIAHYLSAGTIKGQDVLLRAIEVLSRGGFLIVDEMENHLNKRLVGIIISLFTSSELNPHGATLIFSTHYIEVLDFLKRKDNVYFLVRDQDYNIESIKYSDRISRIENKKSEVFFSNYIKGTAPKYSEILSFKKLLKGELNA